MPYDRPTLTELRDQAVQDVNGQQVTGPGGNTLIALLVKSVLRYVLYSEAGLAWQHYGYQDWIAKQAVPFTATGEIFAGWAALKGVFQKDATATVLSLTFTGAVTTPPKDIPAGTPVTRGADGAAFVSTVDATVGGGGTATVTVQAVVPGSAGNTDAGSPMLLANAITGVQSAGVVASQITAGADQETFDAFKTRGLLAYAEPAQGGNRADYITWSESVPGVTRVWINPNGMGSGTIVLYFMMDLAEAAFGGFPQGTNGVATNEARDVAATGDQLTLANAIYTERKVTALVYSCAPIAAPVAFTISDLGSNNTAAMQTSITAALADMFLRLGQVGGTVNPDTGAAWPAIEPSSWYAALESIPGLTGFKIPTPAAAITPTAGQLFTVGALTFNT